MGDAGEANNTTHQQKSMDIASLKTFRDRFDLALSDKQVESFIFLQTATRLARNDLHRGAAGGNGRLNTQSKTPW